MILDYIIHMDSCTIPTPLIIKGIDNAQTRINNNDCIGSVFTNNSDFIDITEATHLVTHLEYKNIMVRVKIEPLDNHKGQMFTYFLSEFENSLYPVLHGELIRHPLTRDLDEWIVNTVVFMDTFSFPTQSFDKKIWSPSHFDETLFSL